MTDNIKVVPFALTFHGGVGKLASKVMSLEWALGDYNGKKIKMLSDQFRRAIACAVVKGNTDAFYRFNEPVRARLAAREEEKVGAHLAQWLEAAAAARAAAALAEAAGGDGEAAAHAAAAEGPGDVDDGSDHDGSALSQGQPLY